MSQGTIAFSSEKDFEDALVKKLTSKGWKEVIKNPDEDSLKDNFAKIVFQHNQQSSRLNGVPLNDDELNQIISAFNHKSPYEVNAHLLGGSVNIRRTNPKDTQNYGKNISLDIFFPKQIGEGNNVYQIARQPILKKQENALSERKGDLTLLINGLPLIHIELKASGHSVEEGINQIEFYLKQGRFTGIFSTVQLFVSMTPEDARYFSNPGASTRTINRKFTFSWADFNNQPKNDWQSISESFLAIPEAHRMIAYYTVADKTDGLLKVMRSYQCFATQVIRDRAGQIRSASFVGNSRLGGYIWHTTGSGKTMTSFKAAQLISDANFADKVIFVLDRIELGNQSRDQYNNFGGEQGKTVSYTANTDALSESLMSTKTDDKLIVTSLQKLACLVNDPKKAPLFEKLADKRFAFIVDECHRSTFGDTFPAIQKKFQNSVFFGFTGTPIKEENKKADSTTVDLFGSNLHTYTLADGINDGNVLPFNCTMVKTVDDDDLREKVALREADAKTLDEALADPEKKKIYNRITDPGKTSLITLEGYLTRAEFGEEHRKKVVEDILKNFARFTVNKKFHAIFATASIEEAIQYFDLFNAEIDRRGLDIRVTAIFDPHIDYHSEKEGAGQKAAFKEDAVQRIINGYNQQFGTSWSDPAVFKTDVLNRLAHKKRHSVWHIDRDSNDRLDIVIVVNQLLTGYDSKWVNTLFVDRELEYQDLIQAFSRTNRLLDDDKLFGQIRYYRKPHTMQQNIKAAVKLYSGENPPDIFIPKLHQQIEKMDEIYREIEGVFTQAGVPDFSSLPKSDAAKRKFASAYGQLINTIKTAKLQGFSWGDKQRTEVDETTGEVFTINEPLITEKVCSILTQRYKELRSEGTPGPGGDPIPSPPFHFDYVLNVQTSEKINKDYLNSNFKRFLIDIRQKNISVEEEEALYQQFHSGFCALSQEEQVYAEIVISQIRRGELQVAPEDQFMGLVYKLKTTKQEENVKNFTEAFDLDDKLVKEAIHNYVPGQILDKGNKLQKIMKSGNSRKIIEFMKAKVKKPTISGVEAATGFKSLLGDFIQSGGKLDVFEDFDSSSG
ncbi:type I restriction endonuclease subunit R, EcoR124 family [Turicimonas muris]|uniref:type I restriction endonuclease subunit R, EcoR124 family n=4 Tax=Turicimonas muris TaxID=1796652 RepID=UPI0026F3AC31|nr:HsdR family type I site-specific deoxyribonuclease [Turicimonas muris]